MFFVDRTWSPHPHILWQVAFLLVSVNGKQWSLSLVQRVAQKHCSSNDGELVWSLREKQMLGALSGFYSQDKDVLCKMVLPDLLRVIKVWDSIVAHVCEDNGWIGLL